MCERWGGRRRRRLGIQNQKQELHTELWGIKICNVFFNHKMAVSLRRKRDFSKIVGRCKICGVVFLLCTPVCFSSSSSSFSSPPRVSHTHNFVTQCHTQLFHTPFSHNSFTHTTFHTHTPNSFKHIHTTLSHATLSHPSLSRTIHNSFTQNFVTRTHTQRHTTLSHASLSHTHTILSHSTLSHITQPHNTQLFLTHTHNFVTHCRLNDLEEEKDDFDVALQIP